MHKYPLEGRICSSAWSLDGRLVAIGMFDGKVTIRDPTDNNEVVRSLKFKKKLMSKNLGFVFRLSS